MAPSSLATDDDLDELIGSVAVEANHEPNRRRRQRLDAAAQPPWAADRPTLGVVASSEHVRARPQRA
jgi:hypothetical protein